MGEVLFRLLIKVYPRWFRARYADELIEFFRDERSHRRYRIPVLGTVRFFGSVIWDHTRAAARIRSQSRHRVERQQMLIVRRRIGFMDKLWQDVRYSLRGMAKRPTFTLVVVATLALGIGANAAIFSVINSVLLRSLPYQQPEGLVFVWEQNYQRDVERNVVSPANYFAWQEQNEVFSDIGAVSEMSATITGDQGPERIGIVYMSPSIFEMLGARAHMGRLLVADDAHAAAEGVVVLSYGIWQRRYGSDPNIVGRTVTLNGLAAEVVGVLPQSFDFQVPVRFNSTGSRDVWIPARFDAAARTARGRWLQVLARLQPGISLERAQNNMKALAARLESEYPEHQAGWTVNIVPLRTQMVGDVETPLFVLYGSVTFILLIACANVANLLLARATGRQREIAVRSALGAGRRRVIRQLLTESTMLAIAGGVVGLLLAYVAVQAMLTLGPQNLPRIKEVRIDHIVIGFTLALSVLTGILFGTLPAFRMSGMRLREGLVNGGERGGTAIRQKTIRSALVVAEFALSMILLVGAGLLIRSFARLLDVDVGFDTRNVVTAQLSLPERDYPDQHQRVQFFEDIVTRVRNLPGVSAASAITSMPLGGAGSATSFWANDRPVPPDGEYPVADVRWVHRDFHKALGVPLVAGRFFGPEDTENAPLCVLINETAARELWPYDNAVGKMVSMPWGDTLVAEIVGIVGDVRHDGPATNVRAKIYWDHRQFSVFNEMTIFARSRSDAAGLSSSLRRTVNELDPNLPVYNVRTVEANRSDILAQDRFTMLALGLFAAVALLLASVGIYGVISYTVDEQSREIGIKMALGARAGMVTYQVLRTGVRITGLAVLLGTAGSLALSRLMSGMVFGIGTNDPVTIAGVGGVLVTVALIACYLPAVRAARVDPMKALRE